MSKHMTAEEKAKWCVVNNCAYKDFNVAYAARAEMLAGFDHAHHDVPLKLLKKWRKEKARKQHYSRMLSPALREDARASRKERGLKVGKKAMSNTTLSRYGYSWERT